MTSVIIWYRRDLRLADHPPLTQALDQGSRPVPVYIHDDREPLGGASAWWLHHSLTRLQQALRELGSDLLIFKGRSDEHLPQLAREYQATAVFWQRRYEPRALAQEEAVSRRLKTADVEAKSFCGSLLQDPQKFAKGDGTPYRVFTPFWNALYKRGPMRTPSAAIAGNRIEVCATVRHRLAGVARRHPLAS